MILSKSKPKLASVLIQGGLIAGVLLVVISAVIIGRENILSQGMATGFGFLERSTGWPMNFSIIETSSRSTYGRVLFAGLLNTTLVGFLALLFATIVGIVLGLMRVSSHLLLNIIGTIYVEVFRNVPMILQAFFWYAILTHLPGQRDAYSPLDSVFLSNRGLSMPAPNFSLSDLIILFIACVIIIFTTRRMQQKRTHPTIWAWVVALLVWVGIGLGLLVSNISGDMGLISFPELKGLRMVGGFTVKPEFSALLISLTLFGGAYIGEIVRGGLLSVDRGKLEAGAALGLNGWQINRLIRLPLAFRAMLPSLTNQYVWLMKATTVGIAIGYPDYFMIIATSINQSGQTLELIALLMGGFLIINYSIASSMNALNTRLKIKGAGS